MLSRFIRAQDHHPFSQVLKELQNGRKVGHWIWYIYPQIKGLGMSTNSEYYGLDGIEEARLYLAHPVLGARLRECCSALLEHNHQDILQIMGSDIDVKKLCSSMTLFITACPEEPVFQDVLYTFFNDAHCPKTYWLLGMKQ